MIETINEAKTTHGAHLIIRSDTWSLFYNNDKVEIGVGYITPEECRAARLPIIDANPISWEVLDTLERLCPKVAVGCEPDAPPYDTMYNPSAKAPLEYVADIYRISGAKTYNIKPYYLVESWYKKYSNPG